jgi:hypothetical protein
MKSANMTLLVLAAWCCACVPASGDSRRSEKYYTPLRMSQKFGRIPLMDQQICLPYDAFSSYRTSSSTPPSGWIPECSKVAKGRGIFLQSRDSVASAHSFALRLRGGSTPPTKAQESQRALTDQEKAKIRKAKEKQRRREELVRNAKIAGWANPEAAADLDYVERQGYDAMIEKIK